MRSPFAATQGKSLALAGGRVASILQIRSHAKAQSRQGLRSSVFPYGHPIRDSLVPSWSGFLAKLGPLRLGAFA